MLIPHAMACHKLCFPCRQHRADGQQWKLWCIRLDGRHRAVWPQRLHGILWPDGCHRGHRSQWPHRLQRPDRKHRCAGRTALALHGCEGLGNGRMRVKARSSFACSCKACETHADSHAMACHKLCLPCRQHRADGQQWKLWCIRLDGRHRAVWPQRLHGILWHDGCHRGHRSQRPHRLQRPDRKHRCAVLTRIALHGCEGLGNGRMRVKARPACLLMQGV